MNRLTNYLESMKLAKAYLVNAAEYERRGKPNDTARALLRAMEYMITANNNLASIAFNKKAKRAK